MSDIATDNEQKIPSCIDLMFYWRRCSAFTNHFHHYYIYGEFPSCEFEKENIKKCFAYKMYKTEKYKKEFMEVVKAIHEKENPTTKTSIKVWKLRKNPSGDWRKKEFGL